MTRRSFRILALALAASLLSSCAYMQVHKQVEEQGRSFRGHQFDSPKQVYRLGEHWYLAATPAEFRLHHPAVHDSVFQGNTETEMRLIGEPGAKVAYHPISAGTAKVLMREDGYADLQTLADELSTQPGSWRSELPGAQAYPIRAQLVGTPVAITPDESTPAEPSVGTKALGSVVFVLVDIPGTLAYNIAVPFMAPYVFFRDFMAED